MIVPFVREGSAGSLHLSQRSAADAEEVVLRANEDHAIRDGRGCHADVADWIAREQFQFGAGFDHLHATLFASEIEPAVRCDRRSSKPTTAANTLLIHLFSGLALVTGHQPIVVASVEMVAVDDRRGHVSSV